MHGNGKSPLAIVVLWLFVVVAATDYLDGYLAVAERRYEDAIAAYRRSDLERPHIRVLLADAYARNRDRENARLWYQRALEVSTGLDSESVIARPIATAWLAKNR